MIYVSWFLFGILFGLGMGVSALAWTWSRQASVRLRRFLTRRYGIDF